MKTLAFLLLLSLPFTAQAHIFREPDKVCTILEPEGLKLAEPWKENAWRDYSCATAYLPMSQNNGVPTNISYYAEAEQPDEVVYMVLVLNINDDGFREPGKTKYLKTVDALFKGLEIHQPEALQEAIKTEKPQEFDEEYGKVSFEILRGATDTLKLTVRNRRG